MDDPSPRLPILYIDDDPDARRAVSQALHRQNLEVTCAASGLEALHVALDGRFPVIITELGMPGINGATLIQRLHRLQPGALFVVLTGMPPSEVDAVVDRFDCVSEVVNKPWQPNTLIEAVKRSVERASQPEIYPMAGNIHLGTEVGSVLLIEDNPADAFLMSRAFQKIEPRRDLVTVETIGAAVQALQDRPFEAILCDLELPDAMDLMAVQALVSASPDSAILVVSGSSSKTLATRAMRLGAQDFLVKGSYEPQVLDRALRYAVERKRTEQRLKYIANHDPLTGLETQSTFRRRLKRALAQAKTETSKLGVLFVDVDNFKQINDTLGHDVGDGVLVGIAERIQRSTGEHMFAARVGGDEFAILVEHASSDEIQQFAERLMAHVEEPQHIGTHHVCASLSIGASQFPQDGRTVKALLKTADAAMYRSKRESGSCFTRFSANAPEAKQEVLPTTDDLIVGLARDEFSIHYQPQYSLQDGTLIGFEALLRWRKGGGELMLPASFIHCLEDSGLIREVGQWVIRSACAQLQSWRRMGHSKLRMSVNVSPRQLDNRGLIETVKDTLAEFDLPADALELELTERVVMEDHCRVNQTLLELQGSGVRLAIDDFGTGYASLGYLQRLQVHTLKIDRTFVAHVDTDPRALGLLTAVVSMGKQLGLCVVVEGIETEGQLAAVQTTGAQGAQGYYLGKPLPADSADDALAHANAAERIESTGDLCIRPNTKTKRDIEFREAV